MTEDELAKIFRILPPPQRRQRQTFRIGDTVRIISGPFASFTGTIEGINQAKARLKMVVTIYDHTLPLRVNFIDVAKVPAS